MKYQSNNLPILIHAPNWLGDHIMAFPFYAILKKKFPNNDLHLIGRSWVSNLLPKNIFSEIFILENKNPTSDILNKLKKNNYIYGFTLSPSFRSAWLLKKAKIKYRLGYKTDCRFFLLKYPKQTGSLYIPKYYKFEHRSLSYIRLLTPFYDKNKIAEDYWVQMKEKKWDIEISGKDKTFTKDILKKYKVKNFFWIICPGSVAKSKIYPIKHLIQLVNTLDNLKKPPSIVLVGTSVEEPYSYDLISNISTRSKRLIVNLTNKTTLPQLFSLLKEAKGIIANDSGLAHMTFLTKTPLVTFLGMGRKEETLSLNPHKVVLNKNLQCAPCMNQKCLRSDYPLECLDTIPFSDVLKGMQKFDKNLIF